VGRLATSHRAVLLAPCLARPRHVEEGCGEARRVTPHRGRKKCRRAEVADLKARVVAGGRAAAARVACAAAVHGEVHRRGSGMPRLSSSPRRLVSHSSLRRLRVCGLNLRLPRGSTTLPRVVGRRSSSACVISVCAVVNLVLLAFRCISFSRFSCTRKTQQLAWG
jgi:hypothetical protein